ncbi:hypothetical protein Ciccas_004190 [Cichlidogyrus casuarinus]|uniref:Uncharacterized protein n=1 Tax=Cichlidogyrus casuarinus TaxID=1844966 RepID=A0ABD2QCA1_9PLAT
MEENLMPCWYYDNEELSRTPSVRDNIPIEKELLFRKHGALFIIDLSRELKLIHITCATAVVFFHRFYMIHSFQSFPLYVTAACCVMLAGKVEETPKKASDIIRRSRGLLKPENYSQFGENPIEKLIGFERVLLKTMHFDFLVKHPYSFLTQFAKRIKSVSKLQEDKSIHLNSEERQHELQNCVQNAWTFINDSLSTTLCLQWEPEIIACAVLYLAAKMSKVLIIDWEGKKPGVHKKWWECFVEGMSSDILQKICHCVLDVYQTSQATQRPSTSTKEERRHSHQQPVKPQIDDDFPNFLAPTSSSVHHSQSVNNLPSKNHV